MEKRHHMCYMILNFHAISNEKYFNQSSSMKKDVFKLQMPGSLCSLYQARVPPGASGLPPLETDAEATEARTSKTRGSKSGQQDGGRRRARGGCV